MELDAEQQAILVCQNSRCGLSLFDAGVDEVSSSVTVRTTYRIYREGGEEAVATENEANDDNEDSLCCGTCGYWLTQEAQELLEEIFNFGK